MLRLLAALLSLAAASRQRVGWDKHGRLSFLQTEAEAPKRSRSPPWHTHKELYPVEVSFDLQELDAHEGVSMVFDGQRRLMRLQRGLAPLDGLAFGHFDDRIAKTGWSELVVETAKSPVISNDVKVYSAGFVEGVLTSVRISDFNANVHMLLGHRDSAAVALKAVKAAFQEQISFMKERANLREHLISEEPADPYWKHARYMLFQLWGLADGYNVAARKFAVSTIGLEDLLLLNAGAELPRLLEASSPDAAEHRTLMQTALSFLQSAPGSRSVHRQASMMGSNSTLRGAHAPAEDPLDDLHWEQRLERTGHCTAFLRVAGSLQDLYAGHTTWDDYSKMTRVFKYYKFHLPNADTVAGEMAFSGYPGVLSSTDDFYVLGSGLVTMETSIEILDTGMWDKIDLKPRLPTFVHVMATNRLAKSASDWAQVFSKGDCAACASQWMAVDYNQFTPGAPLQNNTFWLVEAVPGMLRMKDMTFFLRDHGYWPSFNRPYFKEVREVSGHAAAERSHGSLYSWSANPRAKIFSGVANGINGLFDMRAMMNRNMYPHASQSPGHEISARMDLSKEQPIPNGGIDAKVVNRCLVRTLQAQAVSGPSHSTLAPFRWATEDGTELWPGWPHVGMPNIWDFNYVQVTPTGFKDVVDNTAC